MKKYGSMLMIITCVITNTALIAVLTAAASLTVLVGDDFAHGVRVGAFHVSLPRYFAASLLYVKDLYTTWQGTWFSMFLQAFLSPINNFGLPQLKAVMVGNALLFFAALLTLLWVGLSCFRVGGERLPRSLRLGILTVFFATALNADVYAEIYFWFSGAVAYSMPFSLLLFGLALFLLANQGAEEAQPPDSAPQREMAGKKRRAFCAVTAGLLLFFASGGSLTVAGVGCYTALLLTAVFFLRTKKVSACNLAMLGAGVAGALINVAAPGNFLRHDGTAGAGLHVGRAFVDTAGMFLREGGRLFQGTILGLAFLLLVAAGLYLAGKCEVDVKVYGAATALGLLAGPAAEFPVALGYSSASIPNRCYFIIDTALVLALLNLALFLGVCLHKVLGAASDAKTVALLLYVCLAALIVTPLKLEEQPLCRVARKLYNGSYRAYREECLAIYDYLASCPEEDVVLDMPGYIEDFTCFYFDSDAKGWVNVAIASYYGKNTVRRPY